MYCNKCGKEINYDSTVCYECASAMAAQAEQQNGGYSQPAREYNTSAEPTAQAQPCYYAQPIYTPQNQMPATQSLMPVLVNEPKKSGSKVKSTRMCGFKMALTGAIVSGVSEILMVLVIAAMMLSPIAGFMLMFVTIAACTVSIIFGIKSINTFKRVKREGNPVPVATLVLGIISLATAVFVLLYTLLYGSAMYSIFTETGYYRQSGLGGF